MAPVPVRFGILGPVRVRRAGAEQVLGGPQEQALLALLLARTGQPVTMDGIVDVLWGRRPPASAVNVVRRHVGSLRRLLEPGLPARATGGWLVRDAGGYRLATDADSLDLMRFRLLRDEARRDHSPARTLELLTEALSLWRGPVAAGLPEEVRERAGFAAVARERLAAVRESADAALRAGVPDAVLPALRETAAGHPLDEPLLARLVLALAATGQRAEALAAYRAVSARLADELGIDPGAELRAAHRTALGKGSGRGAVDAGADRTAYGGADRTAAGGADRTAYGSGYGTARPSPPGPGPVTSPVTSPVPAQLPHDLLMFTGRRGELDEVLALFAGAGAGGSAGAVAGAESEAAAASGRSPGTVVISAIAGMAGIGKTTLAVHWAHRVAHRFPDGQLYVNLRGFDPSGAVMGAGEAVRLFLDALGVPPERVPHGVDAQAALYRGLLAGKRFLVLLDNARDTEQVRPLLPGAPGCLAIVTSRRQLSGLVAAHGAHTLTLRPLDAGQAEAFLARRLGAARLAGAARAVAEITDLCAGLPLALACVAARAAARPGFPLAAVAAELRAAHGSLDAFSRSDPAANVGAVFSWSSNAVPPDAARLFRLLALHPGPDFAAPAAAALAGLPERTARRLLAELADVHLVNEPAPGRYAFHDLLRAHAAELLHARHPAAERHAATDRLFAYYLHSAHTAARLLAPHADLLPPGPVPAGVTAEALDDEEGALTWLGAEYKVLLAVVEAGARARGEGAGVEPGGEGMGSGGDGTGSGGDGAGSGGEEAGSGGEEAESGGDGSPLSSPEPLPRHDRRTSLLAWSLEPFLDRRGHWHDGAAAQRTALDAALRLAEPLWEAHGLRALARAEGRLGLHDLSGPRLERALALFGAERDIAGQAHTHRSLGWECEQRGDLPGALRHNRRALELFQEAGDRAALASVLNSVGWYHALLGQYRQALEHCFRALTMLQDLGDSYGQASTWHSIGYAHHHLGRHPHALLAYRNALALYRELGVPYLEASTLVDIGDTEEATGDLDAADTARRQALVLLTALGHADAERVRARLRDRNGRRDLA
ncbi:transcriptional regulator, SARP family [Actinobacteria bacterium OK074]|nr:transcriptional regulator, SARP family [Actinobacteria bacterium OK074]